MLTFTFAAIIAALLLWGIILFDLATRRKARIAGLKWELKHTDEQLESVAASYRRWKRRAEELEKELQGWKDSYRESHQCWLQAESRADAYESRLALALLEEKRLRKRCETLAKPHRDQVIFLDDLIES